MTWPRRIVLASSDAAIGRQWSVDSSPVGRCVWFDLRIGRGAAIQRDGTILSESADPFVLLDWMAAYPLPAGDRWVGSIDYEFNRCIEPLPPRDSSGSALPTFAFWQVSLRPPASETSAPPGTRHGRIVRRSMRRDQYLVAAQRSIDYIAAGDVFQINLAQRLTVETDASPGEVWANLQDATPSHYGAWLEFDDRNALLCNSPELFFQIDRVADGGRRIVNRPIKGTRPNGPGMAAELERSAKDRAELAMIVDLQRNDLGRVCEIGSVRVADARAIETHPTVVHGVATIDGRLRPDVRFGEIVRALFPCGSITGCPKIRAMQIINELEPVERGPYCGAIGWLAADGSAQFNVAIRTIVMQEGSAHVYVGGGIVADSTPQAEYDETLVKARAMLSALGVDRIIDSAEDSHV